MKYRLVAKVLGVEVNEARSAARSCERKREHFQLLYDTGRLCGYRATTIVALQSGETTSEELARRAFAHLEGCASCRAEHHTNAKRLRRSFQGQAAALLPVPALLGRLPWLLHLDARIRTLQHRGTPGGLPFGSGGVRERAVALLASGGAAAKVATGVATVAVIAGGTIGATHLLNHEPARHRHLASRHNRATRHAGQTASPATAAPFIAQPATKHREHRGPGHVISNANRVAEASPTARREPGGFAYLGVPREPSSASVAQSVHTAPRGAGGAFSP